MNMGYLISFLIGAAVVCFGTAGVFIILGKIAKDRTKRMQQLNQIIR